MTHPGRAGILRPKASAQLTLDEETTAAVRLAAARANLSVKSYLTTLITTTMRAQPVLDPAPVEAGGAHPTDS